MRIFSQGCVFEDLGVALVEKRCRVRVLGSLGNSISDWAGFSALLARESSEEEQAGEPRLLDEAGLRHRRNTIVGLVSGGYQRACQVVAKNSGEVYKAEPWRK
jgi:hypothetical protein